jgi:hypothetical protein
MKLKNMIIETEYETAFPEGKEFIDWVNAIDYEYNEADNVPALIIDNRVNIVLHKDNKDEYSPYVTVNS